MAAGAAGFAAGAAGFVADAAGFTAGAAGFAAEAIGFAAETAAFGFFCAAATLCDNKPAFIACVSEVFDLEPAGDTSLVFASACAAALGCAATELACGASLGRGGSTGWLATAVILGSGSELL